MEEGTAFESKGAKKYREHDNIAKANEQKAIRAARKGRKLLKMEAKKKKRVEQKKAAKTQTDQGQMVQHPSPVTLKEYM